MGILSSLLGGLGQAVHGATKGLDEAVEYGGGLGPLGSFTKSLVGLTEHLAPGAEHEAAHTSGPATGLGSKVSGFFSGIGDAITGNAEPLVMQETQKVGRSAIHYNGVVTSPPVTSSHEFNLAFDDFNHGLNGTGAGYGASLGGITMKT